MNFKNLLPQDTRSSELLSAAALIILGMSLMSSQFGRILTQPPFFIILEVVSILFGGIQLTSLLFHPKLELSRVIFAWVNGTFWIWLSYILFPLSSLAGMMCIVLAISDYAAFLINLNILRIIWKP